MKGVVNLVRIGCVVQSSLWIYLLIMPTTGCESPGTPIDEPSTKFRQVDLPQVDYPAERIQQEIIGAWQLEPETNGAPVTKVYYFEPDGHFINSNVITGTVRKTTWRAYRGGITFGDNKFSATFPIYRLDDQELIFRLLASQAPPPPVERLKRLPLSEKVTR
jgi:hypothetical protein